MSYVGWDMVAEFAPGFSPLALPASGDWVVLGDLLELHMKRGRQDDSDAFEAGTLSLVLDNSAEDLDQSSSASPLFGTDALPFTPIRVVGVKRGTERRVVFSGFTLDGFVPDGLRRSQTVSVQCVDWLGWANSVPSQDSQWGAWAGYAQPTAWMRGESRRIQSGHTANPTGRIYNAAAVYTGAGFDFIPDSTYPQFVLRTDGIVLGSSKPAVNLGNGTVFGGMKLAASLAQTGIWVACGWFKALNAQTMTWAGSDWSVSLDASGHVNATIDVNGFSESDTVTVDHTDEVVHMWILKVRSTGATRDMSITTDLGTDSHSFGAAGVSGGGVLSFRGVDFVGNTAGDFVYFDGANLTDLFAVTNLDGLTPAYWATPFSGVLWLDDQYGKRLEHVCGAVGAAVPDYSVRTGATHELDLYLPTGTLASDARVIGDAYLGATYCLRDGSLRFRDATFTRAVSLGQSALYDYTLLEARVSDESATDTWVATRADLFTRADAGTLGGLWNLGALSGTFGIISNAAYVSDDSTTVPMHYFQDIGRDVALGCDLANPVLGQGVMVRRLDFQNYISVAAGTGTVNVTAWVDGVDTLIGTTGADALSTRLDLTTDDNVITVQVNGGTIHTFTITDPALMAGVGVGLIYTDLGVLPANTARWDSFAVGCTRPLIRPVTRARTGTRVDRVVNSLTVNRINSSHIYYQDADSIARYGTRAKTLTASGLDGDILEDYTADLLTAKKDPPIEVGDLTIRPYGNQYLTDWVMRDLELERAVTYREALYDDGTEIIDATYRIAAESWDWQAGVDWTVTLKLVPA